MNFKYNIKHKPGDLISHFSVFTSGLLGSESFRLRDCDALQTLSWPDASAWYADLTADLTAHMSVSKGAENYLSQLTALN